MASVSGASLDISGAVDLGAFIGGVGFGTPSATSFTLQGQFSDTRQWQYTGTGFADYDSNGIPHSGTVTGVNFNHGGTVVTGLSLSMTDILDFADQGDYQGLVEAAYSGDDTVTGSSSSDSLYAYGGHNTLIGGAGSDAFTMMGGVDDIDGGAGENFDIDSVAIERQSTPGTTYDLTNISTSTGATLADGSTIKFVEDFHLDAGDGADTLIYNGPIENLSVYNGGGGVDTMIADLSSNTAGFEVLSDRIHRLDGIGGVIFMFNVERLNITGGSGGDELRAGPGDARFFGGDGGDLLYGATGTDLLNGGVGADRLEGGDNDTMLGGADNDTIIAFGKDMLIDGGAGVDVLQSFESTSSAAMVFSTSSMATAKGAHLADGSIIRNVESFNSFYFGRGADWLTVDRPLTANASYYGRAGVDRLTIDLSSASIAITKTATELDTGAFSLFLNQVEEFRMKTGSGADDLAGGAGADVLATGAGDDKLNGLNGDDSLDGGGGDDTMTGGGGNDTFYVDSALDVIKELVNGGVDGVFAVVSYALGANIENLTLTGFGQKNGTGNTLANTITGAAGVNALNGMDGDDVLNGGRGHDTLIGGIGADKFVFTTHEVADSDSISDFAHAEDKIQLDHAVFDALGAPAATLAVAKFWAGTDAHDANDRVIYNSATGELFYDDDGNGVHAKVLIATLSTHPTLTNADIQVV